MHYIITPHAVERFRERANIVDMIREQLTHGVPFGAQFGENKYLLLLPCGLVAAVESDGRHPVVKTILTKEFAVGSMQSRGIDFREQAGSIENRLDENRAECARMYLERIISLAKDHVARNVPRKARNAELRRLGYDTSGDDGILYRLHYNRFHAESVKSNREDAIRYMKGLQVAE